MGVVFVPEANSSIQVEISGKEVVRPNRGEPIHEEIQKKSLSSRRHTIRFIAIKLHAKDQLHFRAVLHNVVDLTFVIPNLEYKVSAFLQNIKSFTLTCSWWTPNQPI